MSQPTTSFNEELLLARQVRDRERARYTVLCDGLAPYRHYFEGKHVLDFGCGFGLSAAVLVKLGVGRVVGVEPHLGRATTGQEIMEEVGLGDRVSISHVDDTTALPFEAGRFDFILANAVLEHIPQPRGAYLEELWRVLTVGGRLLIVETPNTYYPKDTHTTQLWFNHWLPKDVAYRRAIRRKRFNPDRTDWDSSGWRGLGYLELKAGLGRYKLIPEDATLRHRLLTAVGLPASLIDPYPMWLVEKL